MNTKREITRILSLTALLLLPAFAAAGQRKATRKTAVPRLETTASSFRPFVKPGESASATTQDAAQTSSTTGGQSLGGAGISEGADIIWNAGATQSSKASGTGVGGQTGGNNSGGGAGMSRGSEFASPESKACSWVSETSPTPSPPVTPCSIQNEGAVAHNAQNQGNFTCICDSSGGGNPPAPSNPGGSDPVVTPEVAAIQCAKYGIVSNIILPRAGNASKRLPITTTQGYSFFFTTGAKGQAGQANTNYTDALQYLSISKNICDYDPTLLGRNCAKQGRDALIYYKVGGASAYQCILEPDTTYYINVRDTLWDTEALEFKYTCERNCSFMLF